MFSFIELEGRPTYVNAPYTSNRKGMNKRLEAPHAYFKQFLQILNFLTYLKCLLSFLHNFLLVRVVLEQIIDFLSDRFYSETFKRALLNA